MKASNIILENSEGEQTMIVVIIAGGSGTRLWPLSTSDYPKHLLQLMDNDSLLQSTYKRAKKLSKHIYVQTAGEEQLKLVREQLPELGDDAFPIEPARRDTAGAFIAALAHVQARHDHDEPIALIAADHYTRDVQGFVQSFKIAEKASRDEGRICLVGIEPTYPATGFGYIQKDGQLEGSSLVYNVMMFKEKPDFDTAKKYVQSGEYLWNASYFIGSVNTFLRTMEEYAPELKKNYERLVATKSRKEYEEVFLSFDKISIDYAMMDHTKDLLVVPAAFDWADLGSFADAHKMIGTDNNGNYISGYIELEGVENAYIRNDEGDKPVAVIGLDNVVVVNTPNGVLVARKDLSQKVGAIAKRIQA
ncbi:Mannose-1-phosphate guanylyltransferase (GDP) [candidate division TM7 genomosp. GTL1]|nr:Mannose-1-phosphate guanylyltransferase (GDP) [candidate division TM7 genomosp. GTL1]